MMRVAQWHGYCCEQENFMPFPEDPKSRRGWMLMADDALVLASKLETWAIDRDQGTLLIELRSAFQARALALHARFIASALGRVERGLVSPREGTELVEELTDLRMRARQLFGSMGPSSAPPASPPRGTIPDSL